ncbi:hypothetical protein CU042_03080 [Corynebacterium striatum]|nr:hypothetical protein [Corynebacterium striatum]
MIFQRAGAKSAIDRNRRKFLVGFASNTTVDRLKWIAQVQTTEGILVMDVIKNVIDVVLTTL